MGSARTPNPIQNRVIDELNKIADDAADEALKMLTSS
jgi:hypothetical protein